MQENIIWNRLRQPFETDFKQLTQLTALGDSMMLAILIKLTNHTQK
jgi:hypothetical protein